MAKKNGTDEKLKFLQDTWKKGYTGIKKSSLEKLGFDVTQSKIEHGNFKLIKGFLFGDFDVELMDHSKDLDNRPIHENKPAKTHLQSLYRQGIMEIHSKELHPFNLNTKLGKMTFENITIYQIALSPRYRIDLVDKERGIENKIKDDKVDYKKVLHVLEQFKLRKKDYLEMTEPQLNKKLEEHFKKYFENANKNSPSWKGFFDLEIGNMHFVIEIKKADSLKKSGERQRVSGQVKQYLGKVKKNNFLMLVLGTPKEQDEPNVTSLEIEIKKDFQCYYEYKKVE